MAIARVHSAKIQEDGDTLCETSIWDYSRYAGPPGTRWHLVDSSSYEFRTCADEVADMMEAVRAQKTTIQVACDANPIFRDVVDREIQFLEDCGDVLPGNAETRRLHACHELPVPSLFKGRPGGANPYWRSEDPFSLQAVRALDYPEWADGEPGDDGEMGRDRVPAFIRIEKGHDLAELWRWLEKRQAELATLAKKRSGRGRRKANP